MDIPEFSYCAEEISSSKEIKAQAIQWILDLAYARQPEKYKPKIHVCNNCKAKEGILAVYDSEIIYFYYAYSQPGAPTGLQGQKLNSLQDIFHLEAFKSHFLNTHLIERFSNETNITQKDKKNLSHYSLLTDDMREAARQDVKKFLEPIPEYLEFITHVFDRNVVKLSKFDDGKLLDEINVKNSEVTEYVEAIIQGEEDKIKSFSTYFNFKLMMNAANIREKSGLARHITRASNKVYAKRDRCVETIKTDAKDYYKKRLDKLLASTEVNRIGNAIFNIKMDSRVSRSD